MAPDFSALLAAIGPDRLRANMVERRLLHLPGAVDPEALGLPVIGELDAAFAEGRVRADQLSIYSGMAKLDLAMCRLLDGESVAAAPIAALKRHEMVFVVSDVGRVLPRMAPFVAQAQAELGESIQLGLIASWGCTPGLLPHYDSENLVLVQLAGAKTWRFLGEPAAGSGRKAMSNDGADLPVSGELVMRAGDVLFVPAGLRHQCEADGFSLHLGIGIQHDSGVAIAERLLWMARNDEALNEPLMRASGAGMAEEAEVYRARLHAMLDQIDLSALLEQRLARRVRATED